jgi:hypothetical protein
MAQRPSRTSATGRGGVEVADELAKTEIRRILVSEKFSLLFRRELRDDFLEARIAAEQAQEGASFSAPSPPVNGRGIDDQVRNLGVTPRSCANCYRFRFFRRLVGTRLAALTNFVR